MLIDVPNIKDYEDPIIDALLAINNVKKKINRIVTGVYTLDHITFENLHMILKNNEYENDSVPERIDLINGTTNDLHLFDDIATNLRSIENRDFILAISSNPKDEIMFYNWHVYEILRPCDECYN